ncbi:(2Fe-2S)-binding protein [Sediminispirochaeta smaragdinae]|jgi:carbon-monoxide dehydrogenase small subunit|uniref:(2Fe-2S)-binding domain protein n=1 Tax=Sediminispirochaeta smaragdinae (strain DSM 11293 / JCM 15392 / SEBR 4228) TaxID=573413 RepID=E1R495_SEDSS|nr:(2Fe-2S)-binding protein [Sediminispirochaeta smaragdinae]ADK80517.1 (2Fe-2S)-binding domain protein [Sediminispirochaeta smaragdinae DSM 11293]
MSLVSFTLNGKPVSVEADPLLRLLDLLREDLGLTGVKEGCGEGECGACSVLKDGKIVNSCLIPVATVAGCEIVTPEGLRDTDRGKCIVEAFAESGAVQCGFCTPGMMMATESLLRKNPDPSEAEVREGLSGNLCRCTGYDMIVRGVLLAANKGRGLW